MARGKDPSGPRVGPSFKGRLYQYVKGGQLITAQWPRPRGKPRTENQHREQIRWKCVCWSIKALPAETQNWAREAVKDSPFLPRDILVSMMYGRGPQILLPDGTRITNLATKVNMSEVMDNIAYEEGDVLYRGANLWKGLPRPLVTSYLAFDAALKQPVWVPGGAGGGGGGGDWAYYYSSATSGSAYNCKGNLLRVALPTRLSAVYTSSSFNPSHSHRFSVYRINSAGTILEVLGRYSLQENTSAGLIALSARVDPPLFLQPETRYAVCIEITDQSASFVNPIRVASGGYQLPPYFVLDNAYVRMAKVTPVVGDTFEQGATAFSVPVLLEAVLD